MSMYIAILLDGEVENEINIDLCCPDCCRGSYRWSPEQYKFVNDSAVAEKPIAVPAGVEGTAAFAEFIRTMKL